MTESAGQPVFLVVDEDPAAAEMLVGDLERRFRADYRVLGETSARAALERLDALRESGEQVALIICCESMRAMPGSEVLARSRSTYPGAKRILLIDFGDRRMLASSTKGDVAPGNSDEQKRAERAMIEALSARLGVVRQEHGTGVSPVAWDRAGPGRSPPSVKQAGKACLVVLFSHISISRYFPAPSSGILESGSGMTPAA